MKRLRIIASTLIACSVLALNPIGASAEWKTEKRTMQDIANGVSERKWYQEGDSWATGWRYVEDRLVGDGGVKTKSWFYFEPETGYSVSSGWHKINGNWYLFNPSNFGYIAPYMAQSTIIKPYKDNNYYYLNSDGVWIQNPPEEIKIYINLLQDEEKMKKLKIISDSTKTEYTLGGHNPYERGDAAYVEDISDTNQDGILDMSIQTSFGSKCIVRYENGSINVYNNNVLISSNTNTNSTTNKNISDESGLQFDANTGRIVAYRGTDTELVIPNTINGVKVTSIGNSAFSLNYKLKSITIPNSITSIGKDAFLGCDNLTFNVENEQTKNLLINSGVSANQVKMKQ
ncbi:leucine-rich repeat protein [Clostridium chromiireducens]|uniref:Leucine-rich repeat protein n=1 Tax=Clostridium chromiireducens TaxID=225345 RepID=A0A964W1I0_9CLOT|nr:leucine-rich repeat protein [Clostridium chromiireducens]MVX63098.1 leucine-rich repeat protein [Clostridium chromiireducens]